MSRPNVRLADIQRGGIKTKYQAGIMVDGERIGYVQRERGDKRYLAYADGKRIGSGYSIAEVLADIREYVWNDREVAL